MNPVLRAQKNAAVRQQVRDVAEDAVLKVQTIVDTRKRSACDSFGSTNGLLQYAERAALQCMSQAPPQSSVELPPSSESSESSSESSKKKRRIPLLFWDESAGKWV